MLDLNELKYNSDGLIPAVVCDEYSGEVLMVAYMNRESLEISLKEGRTCFWSRSRKELWRKGETSGNVQHIVRITTDCDNDTLLVHVKADGRACHTGNNTCFFNEVTEAGPRFTMDGLMELIEGRKTDRKEGSYTTYLFDKGIDKILKKVGEESTEVIVAAKGGDRAETIYEIADLAYHVMVLMCEMGIDLDEICAELASRHVVDHKVKQETSKSTVSENK